MKKSITMLLAGLLFAVGLAVSGMTQPLKIIGFLDVTGHWDPSLALVMIGALVVYAAANRWILKRGRPLVGEFRLDALRTIDARLIGGAAIFGVGWGLSGFCPGPALLSAGAGTAAALYFAPAMIVGILIQRGMSSQKTDADCG